MSGLTLRALAGIGEVVPGTDLGAEIVAAAGGELQPGSVVAVAHTVVSKAEGALRPLASVDVTSRARELAAQNGRDPRHVQAVLDESEEVLRSERGVLICRTRHGLVCANAGVDASNSPDADTLVLLPADPDGSARALRGRIAALVAGPVAVLITDSFGRPWRNGQVDVAIGVAGLAPLEDWRGRADAAGRSLSATWLAVADAAAAAADLARAKDSGEPVVVIAGLERFVTDEDGPGAAALLRPAGEDLFP